MRRPDLNDDEQRLFDPWLSAARSSGGEYRGWCIEHEDPNSSSSPSASYNFMDDVWHCMGCDSGGSITKATRELLKREKDGGAADEESGATVTDINTKRKVQSAPLPSLAQIDGWVEKLAEDERLLAVLVERRGLSPETLKDHHIGYCPDKRRYIIPVYDRARTALVNVRMYDPHAKTGGPPKMLPWATGYGTQLYNAHVLDEAKEVVLCEGEMDSLIAGQHGIPTLTHTGGAGSFQQAWAADFAGKHVWICYDEDEGGRKGALRTARMLRAVAAGVYIIPSLGIGKPKADLTDFFMEGNTEERLRELMEEARLTPFAQEVGVRPPPRTGRRVDLEETLSSDYSEPLEVEAMIAGKVNPPYLVPKKFRARCDQSKGKVCSVCPMAAYEGDRTYETAPDDSRLLEFVESNTERSEKIMRGFVEARCEDRVEFEVGERWSLEELILVQSVEARTEEVQNPISRKAFSVGTYRSAVNTGARMVGSQVPDPRSNRGIFHSWSLESVRSELDGFELTEDDMEELSVFQVSGSQTPLDKCKEIAADMAANVSRIYGRPDMHVAYDLVWHSALGFSLRGQPADKGWLECLVVGDSRTGKSEIAKYLAKHYQAGIVKSCEGASFAGLVGGAEQTPQGKGWMVRWGTIPLNDRRLVVLDEMSGMMIGQRGESKGIIEQMSSIRSSGRAELTKIVSEETSARTRLIWISNPGNGLKMAAMAGGGMDAIKQLIPNQEDIARYDFALAADEHDVPAEEMNALGHTPVPHVHTSSAASKLVTWAWSRRSDQVVWRRQADELVLSAALETGARYVSDPPLVQVQNIRMKIARLAVAFAARTFSTNRDATLIVVKPEHVTSAVNFLDWIYGADAMGYLRLSRRTMADRTTAEAARGEVVEFLRVQPGVLEALRGVRDSPSGFRPRDFEEMGGADVDSKAVTTSMLKWKMIRRMATSGGKFALEPVMVEILKQLEDEGL